jgi:putative redox protein
MRPAIISSTSADFRQTVRIGEHTLVADEPVSGGGQDAGPAPHEWLLAGLGVCTSMTLGMYARRKGWPLEDVEVTVRVAGDLTDEQRTRLLEIANKCPVHRTLSGKIVIETDLAAR